MLYAVKSVARKKQESDSSRTERKVDSCFGCQDAVQRTLTYVGLWFVVPIRFLANPLNIGGLGSTAKTCSELWDRLFIFCGDG